LADIEVNPPSLPTGIAQTSAVPPLANYPQRFDSWFSLTCQHVVPVEGLM
jgi:hypothetical protein